MLVKAQLQESLVKKSGMFAIDTDDLIEKYGKQKNQKIFEVEGEPIF